jgi:hypothetical protein
MRRRGGARRKACASEQVSPENEGRFACAAKRSIHKLSSRLLNKPRAQARVFLRSNGS